MSIYFNSYIFCLIIQYISFCSLCHYNWLCFMNVIPFKCFRSYLLEFYKMCLLLPTSLFLQVSRQWSDVSGYQFIFINKELGWLIWVASRSYTDMFFQPAFPENDRAWCLAGSASRPWAEHRQQGKQACYPHLLLTNPCQSGEAFLRGSSSLQIHEFLKRLDF